MTHLKRALCYFSLIAAVPFAAQAQQVNIVSLDNTVNISGQLLSFDDDFFVLATNIGELTIERENTTCTGKACPFVPTAFDLDVSIAESQLAALMQGLVDDYAKQIELTATPVSGENSLIDRVELKAIKPDADTIGIVDLTYRPQEDLFTDLVEGSADLTLSALAIPQDIAAQAPLQDDADDTTSAREQVIALDAIVPVVHPQNTLRSVSIEELALIASGRISNWSEIGGADAPVRMILPLEGSSLDVTFKELVLDPNRVRLRRSVERSDDSESAVDAVVSDPNAITIATLANAGEANIIPIRQVCGPLAIASEFAIKAEEYPLTQRILAYGGSSERTTEQNDFLGFAFSDAAQSLISDAGFVDQSIVTEAVGDQGTRMTSAILSANNSASLTQVKTFATDLAAAERLSTTFRFTSGSSQLDTKSVGDIQRVANYLSETGSRFSDIFVIGFTDNVGRSDINARIALQRASNVRDALIAANGGDVLAERLNVSAYGPLAPVGCNETAEGRGSNRRVEIWLR